MTEEGGGHDYEQATYQVLQPPASAPVSLHSTDSLNPTEKAVNWNWLRASTVWSSRLAIAFPPSGPAWWTRSTACPSFAPSIALPAVGITHLGLACGLVGPDPRRSPPAPRAPPRSHQEDHEAG